MKRALLLAALTLTAAAAPSADAPSTDVKAAMRMLLAASALPIARSSTCYDSIPGVPRPTLGDLLATPLAGLDKGENQVGGGCTNGACRVRITHDGGEEDVFSYEYRFRTVRGRLSPASLLCAITP